MCWQMKTWKNMPLGLLFGSKAHEVHPSVSGEKLSACLRLSIIMVSPGRAGYSVRLKQSLDGITHFGSSVFDKPSKSFSCWQQKMAYILISHVFSNISCDFLSFYTVVGKRGCRCFSQCFLTWLEFFFLTSLKNLFWLTFYRVAFHTTGTPLSSPLPVSAIFTVPIERRTMNNQHTQDDRFCNSSFLSFCSWKVLLCTTEHVPQFIQNSPPNIILF